MVMRLIDRILWKLPCLLAALALTVACNKIETFDGAFVAFDTAKSSVVSIDAEGELYRSEAVRSDRRQFCRDLRRRIVGRH